MTKDIKKETKEEPEDKKADTESGSKRSCGCGCLPLKMKK
jgi:hypothetical protein